MRFIRYVRLRAEGFSVPAAASLSNDDRLGDNDDIAVGYVLAIVVLAYLLADGCMTGACPQKPNLKSFLNSRARKTRMQTP